MSSPQNSPRPAIVEVASESVETEPQKAIELIPREETVEETELEALELDRKFQQQQARKNALAHRAKAQENLHQLAQSSKQAESDPDELQRASMRIKEAPEYKGKTLREHQAFIFACELNFKSFPEHFKKDITRVLYAARSLTGEAKEAWQRRHEVQTGKEIVTWDEFKQFTKISSEIY